MSRRTSAAWGAKMADAEKASRIESIREKMQREAEEFVARKDELERNTLGGPKHKTMGHGNGGYARTLADTRPHPIADDNSTCFNCGTRRAAHDRFGCKRWRAAT